MHQLWERHAVSRMKCNVSQDEGPTFRQILPIDTGFNALKYEMRPDAMSARHVGSGRLFTAFLLKSELDCSRSAPVALSHLPSAPSDCPASMAHRLSLHFPDDWS